MISRKIESELDSFRKQSNRHALLIDGARQVGKTSIIEAFGKKYYESFIKIDFIRTPEAKVIFKDVENESDILVRLSADSTYACNEAKLLQAFHE